jgi:hypothetical protein
LEEYLEELSGKDILSQRLGGMYLQMAQRSIEQTPHHPSSDYVQAFGSQTESFPSPSTADYTSSTPPPFEFTPISACFFLIEKIRVLDSFGRIIDLIEANWSAYPDSPHKLDPAQFFYPVGGRNMISPWLKPPKKGQNASNSPSERLLQLSPRVIQDSRLNFELTSADGNNQNVILHSDTTPVCAWVLPNHLDRSLVFYGADGKPWGELFLSVHTKGRYIPVWTPAPKEIDDIPNSYVKSLLRAVMARDDNGQGLFDFMRVIDETLWTINPLGRREDQNLSVLIGRPLAIVRGRLSFTARGLPYYNQDWRYTFDLNGGDGLKPVPIGKKDGGLFDDAWPIRLGSAHLRDDGMMGYFMDSDFSTFNAVHVPEGMKSDFIKAVGVDDNYIKLKFNDDSNPNPERQYLTFLLDPRAEVHAFTGLLPVLRTGLPQKFVAEALKTMEYSFRAGPILTAPGAIRIPAPAENKGDWTWVDKIIGENNLAPSCDRARFPLATPSLREGWLNYTPNPKGGK